MRWCGYNPSTAKVGPRVQGFFASMEDHKKSLEKEGHTVEIKPLET